MFEELEWQLGGKVKSVLLVALAAMLLAGYARKQENVLWGVESNPIDDYFGTIEKDVPENARERYRLIYLECWEMELSHAYEMLGKELPASFFEKGGYGEEAERSFREFAVAQGYLEDYYENGVQTAADPLAARVELMRLQTLRIYGEVLEKRGGRAALEELFAFDGQEALRMMKNSKIY